MKKTGIFATEEEKSKLRKLTNRARNTPVIALSVAHGIEQGGFAGEAWELAKKECHKCALSHGLPEIAGYYGITEEGEFITI